VTHGKQPETGGSPPSLPGVFWAFLRLGLTAFGGPAMVAYIGEMAVDKHEWLSRQSFREGVAVAQTIPGATAMQTAAYVGLRLRGTVGAAAAYIGFGLPAFLLMLALSALYSVSHKSPISMSVFHGLQVIVVAIIARAAFTFGRATVKGLWDGVIALAVAGYLISGGSPVVAILAGAVVGLLAYRRASASGETVQHSDSSSLRSTTRQAMVVVLIGVALFAALLLMNRRLFDLASLMLRVDILAFGGGFASVPVMLHSVAEVNHWMSTRTFMDGIAMGQVTPGPIVITATFVGYQVAGVLGALVGTIGIFTPSFLMVLVTVPYFDRLQHSLWFRRAIRGVLASFVGLLVAVAINFGIAASWSIPAAVLALAAFAALRLKVDILWVVLVGAAVSTLLL